MANFLIVGISSGAGSALAKQLLSEGHQVYGTYYKTTPAIPGVSHLQHLDVMDDNLDFGFLPEVIDGIAYCPGAIMLKPFSRVQPQDFINDYQLQLIGAVKVIHACLLKLKNAEHASVVLFSTVAVQTGFSFHTIVSSSKGALEGFTRSLAAELAPKIRVNCIAPSITDTRIAAALLASDEKKQSNAQRHPLKRIGRPEDIGNIAAFLLSEKSSWITGQIIHVDGGISTIKV
jgi:NAD(P)-dependent dehydrogenase (short-subunit alcohol dehydrogenase family)